MIEEFEASGNWLFRRRGFLPVFLLAGGLGFLSLYLPDHPVSPPLWYEALCLGVSLFGLYIRIITIGHTPKHTSGRNIKKQKASVLNTTGIYSMVRHPLYLGNFFMWLGLALFVYHVWFALLAVFIFWLYYERIMFAEESFLRQKFGQDYLDWSVHTPAFFPRFSGYIPASLDFSWKNVLKREYNGFGNLIASFTLVAILRSSLLAGRFEAPRYWVILFALAFLIWLVLRLIEKNTRLFEEEGR